MAIGRKEKALILWFRTCLHCQVAQACWSLRAKKRWCLSGTPLQNAIDDLFSYMRFLRFAPFDDFGHFRLHVKEPAARASAQGFQQLQQLLASIMLRRTKSEGKGEGG